MISMAQSIFIGIGIIALSVAFLLLLDRLWPTEQRRQHNDIVGWQVGVIGTTYAVIVGFMLYAVWNDFEMARNNADAEAVALINVYNLSHGLPQGLAASMQADAKTYADEMIDHEWAAMNRGAQSYPQGQLLVERMWATLANSQGLDRTQQTIVDHSITQLSAMTQSRRMRLIQSKEGLPHILWSVLIIGAVITVASSCLFGTKNFALHLIQVLALSTLLALSLLAVAEIDRPFQGFVHVSPDPFLRAKEILDSPWPNTPSQ